MKSLDSKRRTGFPTRSSKPQPNGQAFSAAALDEKTWGEFVITDVFQINPGKRLTKGDMQTGRKPFIGASDSNNGITGFVSNSNDSLDSNILGVNYNGSVVENFYHPYKALFSDDVKRLSLKDQEGNKYIYLFLKSIVLQQKQKYRYGYKFNERRMNKQILLLPVTPEGKPDYSYMEEYMWREERQKLQTYRDYIARHFQTSILEK